jgi:hypothetical protein
MFEPLGFFDFESPPSPPTKRTANVEMDDDFDMEAELAMMQEEEAETRKRPMFDEPPPPLEEEEPDWEEDEAAMADAWASDMAKNELAGPKVSTQTIAKTTKISNGSSSTLLSRETETMMKFGDSDIFDAPMLASCE